MKAVVATAALALAACTSFDALDRGVCGNGVVEAGEDCDASEPSCVACAVVCASAADCPSADYACGVDARCHAPGGALGEPVTAGPFAVDDYRVTDLDGDGIGDALGLSKTSIVVRHGAQAAALAQTESFVTPTQTGPAAFGDLDLDGSLDVAITTEDGFVAYTSPYHTLAPLDAAAQILGGDGEPLNLLYAFRISDLALGAFIDDGAGHVVLVTADLLRLTASAIEAPCLARNGPLALADFSPERVDVYAANDSALSADVVVAIAIGTTDQKLCVVAVHKDLFGAATLDDITPPNALGAPAGRHPVLADLDGDSDHCPGLVDANGTPAATRYWDGGMSGGHCALASAGAMLPANTEASPGARPAGRIALDPPIAGAATDALMLTDGIYAYAPVVLPGQPSFFALYRTTRELARAAVADLDADGAMDAVLATAAEDDLDVLYRSTDPQGYRLVRLDTASRVTMLATGDFDANGYRDLAYTEQLADHQRLMVAFSTPDRVQPPVEVGSFARAVSLVRLELQDSVDIIARAADLAVVQPGAAASTLTLFHGSPQRTMTPYFDPRDRASSTIFRGAVIGARASGSFADVLGIAAPAPGESGPVLAWRVPGTPLGLDATERAGVEATGLADCAAGGAGLCIADALYLPWPGGDLVIAVDRASPAHAAVLEPWGAAFSARAVDLPAPAGATVRALHAADLDGDGAPELIAAFDGAVLVCAVDGTGTPGACADLAPQIAALAPSTRACIDAVPARASYRDRFTPAGGATDLVVACRDDGTTLYRVHASDGAYAIDALAHTAADLTRVQAGDVTGDGVDDLVAIAGASGSQTLVVYPQCSSREAAACGRSSP